MRAAQPEFVMPEQFFPQPRSPMSGERNLMLAVLKDAIHAYLKHAHSRYDDCLELFAEARDYLDDDDMEYPYSMTNICEVLDIDVGRLRHGLKTFYRAHRPVVARKEARIISLAARRREECAQA